MTSAMRESPAEPSPDPSHRLGLGAAVAGLAAALGCATAFVLAGRTAEVDERHLLEANRDLTVAVLRAQTELEGYLATGATPYLDAHRAALGRIDPLADVAAADGRVIDPRAADLEHDLDALHAALAGWRTDYANPAIEAKADRRSAKLSALRRKGTGQERSRAIEAALGDLHRESSRLLDGARTRLVARERWLLAGASVAFAVFLVAGSFVAVRQTAALRRLHQRSDRLELLAGFAERVHHAGTSDDTASFLAQAVRRHLGASQGIVLFRDETGERLRIAAADGELSPAAASAPVLADATACPAIRTGQRVVVRDVTREAACACPLGAPDSGGYACTPLLAQGRVVGVAAWSAGAGRHVDRADLDHAEALARVSSLALSGQRLLDSAQRDAVTDQLTGVYNRRFLDGFLVKQLQAALRERRSLGLLMLDLDQFKRFNDTHGHQAGDALLKAFAAAAMNCVRDGDLLARYGGEEFVAVLPDAGRTTALDIAERIRLAASAIPPAAVGLPQLPAPVVTVSVGLAVAPAHGRSAPDLLRAADDALYAAKDGGRNRVVHATAPIG